MENSLEGSKNFRETSKETIAQVLVRGNFETVDPGINPLLYSE